MPLGPPQPMTPPLEVMQVLQPQPDEVGAFRWILFAPEALAV